MPPEIQLAIRDGHISMGHARALININSKEDQLKLLQQINTEEMTVDVYKIRWATITSSRFDSAAFKKAMPDLYGRFVKATTTRRFTVA